MSKSVTKELPELITAGIISEDTAENIRKYYNSKGENSHSRLFIVFGIIGALLVGLGISLIIAHNWDDMSRPLKACISFLPLAAGQFFCGYTLAKRSDSTAWKEGASTFLFFAVAACISLISQTYNISGSLSSFLLTWALLCLPLMYIMRSSAASLLFIILITYYACEKGYWSYREQEPYLYWLLLLAAIPYYYTLFKKEPGGNFMAFHNWLIPLSVIISLGTMSNGEGGRLMFVAHMSLFGLLYLLGRSSLVKDHKSPMNGYLILGSLGTVSMLLFLSFDFMWNDFHYYGLEITKGSAPEYILTVILSISAGILFFRKNKGKPFAEIEPIEFVFAVFIITFVIGQSYQGLAIALINIIIFLFGIVTIRNGARMNHLGVLNYGLLIISVLIACRFFDSQMSFVIRGVLFVAVGAGFFYTNYRMLKNRNN